MQALLAGLLNFTTLVQNMAAQVQGSAAQLIDLTVGSVLRAILEASASIALWLQWLILQVLALTRLATSNGSDADSFVNDFGLVRLPGVAATGQVTFSRYNATSAAFIPVGATVLTSDRTQTFAVVADTTQSAYSATQNGYNIPAGTSSANATVNATTAGSGGNVLAGAISLMGTAIPSVDTVTNATGFTNGVNAESDAALRARFVLYVNSRSQGTETAVDYAVDGVQQGMTFTVAENQTANGTYTPGTFVVSIDDGSGNTPTSTVQTVTTAVQAIRPIGSVAVVQAAAKVTANVSMILTVTAGTLKANITPLVVTAITNYINTLPVGATMPYAKLFQLAFDASPTITNVASVTLNGLTADLAATKFQVVRAGTIAVS